MNRIKELREAKKMTQVRLSIELNVSQETVSAYEKEKYFPSYQTLMKLSEIFNTSVDYIMGLSDKRTIQKSAGERQDQLLVLFSELNEVNKEKALAYLQGMLDGEK